MCCSAPIQALLFFLNAGRWGEGGGIFFLLNLVIAIAEQDCGALLSIAAERRQEHRAAKMSKNANF